MGQINAPYGANAKKTIVGHLRVEHVAAVMMDRTAVQAAVFALDSKVDRCLFTDVLHVAASLMHHLR